MKNSSASACSTTGLIILFTLLPFLVQAQYTGDTDPDGPGYAENCSSIMVGRLATVNWSRGRELIEPAVAALEEKALAELPEIAPDRTFALNDCLSYKAK